MSGQVPVEQVADFICVFCGHVGVGQKHWSSKCPKWVSPTSTAIHVTTPASLNLAHDDEVRADRAKWRAARDAEERRDVAGKTSILAEADELVNGPRQAGYGHPADTYGRAARAFNGLYGTNLDATQVVVLHLLCKLSRETAVRKRDNRVDAAGYAACMDLIAQREDKS